MLVLSQINPSSDSRKYSQELNLRKFDYQEYSDSFCTKAWSKKVIVEHE